MAKTLEQLAKEIMAECEADDEPVTEAEALEMARQEMGAKDIKNYTQAEPKKVTKTKEHKVDIDKAKIIKNLQRGLTLLIDSTTIQVENEAKLHFSYNGCDYTVMLTKHRAPKK